MADYPLTQLGTREFENMAQAAVAALFGPDVKIYGIGKDGGREVATRSPIVVNDTSWQGYTVVQVKFRGRPGSVGENAEWLRNEIRKELVDWRDSTKRFPKPDNLLFVTNVALSSVPGHGLDYVESVRNDFAEKLPLAGFAIWHYDHICRLLDQYGDIRAAYGGLITSGDVLNELQRVLTGEAVDLGKIIRRHAVKELAAEQWVRLNHGGTSRTERLSIGQVGIDLTASRIAPDRVDEASAPDQIGSIDHVLKLGEAVMRPSVRTEQAPHIVLVGGPGQGKTTVGQLMCQIYRCALIDDADGFGPDAAPIIRGLRDNLAASGLPAPVMKRWPLRLDLSRYADVLAGDQSTSVLRFIADTVTARVDETVTAPQMRAWLKAWPWLLVLDGFDEVVAPHVREALIDRISDFLIEAHDVDADLLIIATTRPQGYSGEFRPSTYEHLYLEPLTVAQALQFGRRLADVRLHDDPDAHQNVLERLAEASREPMTARLMLTPLQVTIMSLLLEGRARVPQYRYGLFHAYYQTLFSREVDKKTATAKLLEQHRRTVDQLHEGVGLRLQIQAEDEGGPSSDSAMPHAAFEALARELLDKEDYPPAEAQALASKIAEAATRRLVLLVPKNRDDVGFDVRSLQEFMAARALTSGTEEQIKKRLRLVAPSAHWRNTWLLATGRMADQPHYVDYILSMIEEFDARDTLSLVMRPSADLALDLLDDGFAAPSPRVRNSLVKLGVEALRRLPDRGTVPAADILQRATGDSVSTAFIADIARQAVTGAPPHKVTAAWALHRWTRHTGALGALGRQRAEHMRSALGEDNGQAWHQHYLVSGRPDADRWAGPTARLDRYLEPTADDQLDGEDAVALRLVLAELRDTKVRLVGDGRIPAVHSVPVVQWHPMSEALSRPGVAEFLADRLLGLPAEHWAIASTVSELLRQWRQGRRVSADALM